MDKFDLDALLKMNEKKHKSKPKQFLSVADGVTKRLESKIKQRRTSRLTSFDQTRNLQVCESPKLVKSEAQLKAEHRKQQLEIWKNEKEKKKREDAARKKKPFVAGVVPASLKYQPPLPVSKPSITRRVVTRSQTVRNVKQTEIKIPYSSKMSFAPDNACFRPPQNLVVLPKNPPGKFKKKNANIIFDPVIPNSKSNVKSNIKDTERESKQKKIDDKTDSKKVKNGNFISFDKVLPNNKSNITINATVEPNVTNGKKVKNNNIKMFDSVAKNKSKVTNKNKETNTESKQNKVEVQETDSKHGSNITSELKNKSKATNNTKESNTDTEWQKVEPNGLDIKKNNTKSTNGRMVKAVKKENAVDNSRSCVLDPVSPVFAKNTPTAMSVISPNVTVSRGKNNARREIKQKMEEGLLDEDMCNMSLDHFRDQLASEINRLTKMCDIWEHISENTELPEAVQESVLSAMGQARLLMSQKLAQFASLIEKCARPDGISTLVTTTDLHGFWDMVFMQVVNIDMRFKKLEELKERGWVDENPVQVTRKVSKPAVKKSKANAAPSRLRDMIAAARKAKKEQEEQSSAPTAVAADTGKTFEAGFFSVRSPVHTTPRVSTPRHEASLLKAVLSNEAKKASATKIHTSFAMLRASMLAKSSEYEGIAPLPQTPINLQATPGRSILKSTNSINNTGKKSVKLLILNKSEVESSNVSLKDDNEEINKFNKKEISNAKKSVKVVIEKSDLESLDVSENNNNEEETDDESIDEDGFGKENASLKHGNGEQIVLPEGYHVMTRSKRKSLLNMSSTPIIDNVQTDKRSSRKKKTLKEVENIEVLTETPKRNSSSKRSSCK